MLPCALVTYATCWPPSVTGVQPLLCELCPEPVQSTMQHYAPSFPTMQGQGMQAVAELLSCDMVLLLLLLLLLQLIAEL